MQTPMIFFWSERYGSTAEELRALEKATVESLSPLSSLKQLQFLVFPPEDRADLLASPPE
jgi:hypothetical protein